MKSLRDLDYSVLQQCMHCGLCLPSCPTYEETKRERHSPRGRIALMRAIADGELELTKTFGEEMYYCLGCLACTSACPAGVNYAELLETARSEVEQSGVLATPTRSFIRTAMLRVVFTRPRLLRAIGRLLWLWQTSGLQTLARRAGLMNLLPSNLRRLEPQAPKILEKFSHQLIQPIESPVAPRAALDVGRSMLDVERCPAPPPSTVRLRRVVVLTGCVQDLAFADINRATVDVLLANGCEVHTPPVQPCCGSLHAHNGDNVTARDLARRQLDLINPADFDAIISNAGGCGSHLRAYGHLLHDDPAYAQKAAAWSAKLRDIHEYLVEIGFRPPTATAPTTTVTYHESCHLCHGQKVSAQPRAILRALPGVKLRECAESQWCCGSAGIYNITQPETAARLQERKVGHVLATGAHIVATANPGCHLQLANGLAQHAGNSGAPAIEVTHPVVLLARAYAAEKLG
ncbi:MAG: 4Fe-4S dicluster domain-containing protein [Opitutus sp.]|nr:4Fe-4S dicluster domain-containing protein [Opitutus sp.]MCS6246856.1 4Fe-4S dicluster domain-containing protein [Opitutus sp.]MCS6273421.1 4Fe-4S dicluster domain-containing protein [Opitutus sp.]MCS6275766.1 4Fe-4S dicluster domain-containing protein [Opitutus sp.]MCS6300862.1 4Fe-4S dicluster domain-containing protein [Opitutus sp.]